ncbi:protein indeterminate-domain 12-like [Phalaenopsis equestris]|uniref:protein indeterminate-domain 12-like n=1 Tax=Phalaenopsis equestris TaxID=78828 RepID=UPI0009E3D0D1|nr:protein indeterminate-domain 12-like [Phalaenopsis equestris]
MQILEIIVFFWNKLEENTCILLAWFQFGLLCTSDAVFLPAETPAMSGIPNSRPPTARKKRNLPGNPDPDAEVISLSPATLMAPNRFLCEICNRGFQREQNLQLHRRGHNLPWKLRQHPPGGPPARKRVYVCPEPSCVNHDPARALGDLTGIKKHFCRKHGEKKWKCERCGKRYAVQSDHKAHSKTCGSREYRCNCGTLFSRKDSFVTHRAFCDALTRDSAANESLSCASDETPSEMAPPPPPAAYMSATALLQKAAEMGAAASAGSSSMLMAGLLRSTKGKTRDFLGMGRDDGGGRSMEEVARFGSLGSGMEFVGTGTSYNAAGYN